MLCLAALAVGSLAGLASSHPLMHAFVIAELGSKIGLPPKDPFEGMDEMFLLVLGCDETRDPAGRVVSKYGRTDTLQLIRFDFRNDAVGLLHIPRDTVVAVSGYSARRINALFPAGGEELTASAVEKLTGIRPDRVIVLEYAAIRDMVDLVGGVEIYVPKRMKYDDEGGRLHIDLRPGLQTLNGKQAIGFLRYRLDSDFFRGERQQDFLVAFKQELTHSPSKMAHMSDLVLEAVGSGLTRAEVRHLTLFGQHVGSNRIKQGKLPVVEGEEYQLFLLKDDLEQALIDSGLRTPPPPVVSGQ